MAKILVDCENPNDLTSLEAAIEKHFGKCNISYAEQAKVMKEAGLVESRREAAREIAKETEETPEAVHMRIRRGEKDLCHVDTEEPSPSTSSESRRNKENKGYTQNGKPRQRAPGAGRKPRREISKAEFLDSVKIIKRHIYQQKKRENYELVGRVYILEQLEPLVTIAAIK